MDTRDGVLIAVSTFDTEREGLTTLTPLEPINGNSTKGIEERQQQITTFISDALQRRNAQETQRGKPKIKFLTSAEIRTENLSIKALSDLFRLMFYHDTPEYALCMACMQNSKNGRFNARQIWSIPEKQYLNIEDLARITPDACCPDCQEPLVFLHEPEATWRIFEAKLEKDACIGVIQDDKTNDIEGFTFAYSLRWSLLSRQFFRKIKIDFGNKFGQVFCS